MFSPELLQTAAAILDRARKMNWRIVTAESCTGGLVAACLTEIPGSSAVLERGFVVYSNGAKADLLDVPISLIERYGAVSAEVARAMAVGALEQSGADIAVAVTGVAGPGGGSPEKPVGTVHIAAARIGQLVMAQKHNFGAIDRRDVRLKSVEAALTLLLRSM